MEDGVPLGHSIEHQVKGVIVECRACQHRAVLPLHDLIAKLGADFGVRAVAEKCRCSKCGSRRVETRPEWPSRRGLLGPG